MMRVSCLLVKDFLSIKNYINELRPEKDKKGIMAKKSAMARRNRSAVAARTASLLMTSVHV